MNLSTDTLSILNNFSEINNNILFKPEKSIIQNQSISILILAPHMHCPFSLFVILFEPKLFQGASIYFY